MALTIGGIITAALQMPDGAIFDQLKSKRLILVPASAVLAVGAVLLSITAAPWPEQTWPEQTWPGYLSPSLPTSSQHKQSGFPVFRVLMPGRDGESIPKSPRFRMRPLSPHWGNCAPSFPSPATSTVAASADVYRRHHHDLSQ
jgi:hypothetical protein